MRIQTTSNAIETKRDPRVVRSPGQTLEEMLLEQERDRRWYLESEGGTAEIESVQTERRDRARGPMRNG